jgi:hypothetical protein
MLDEDYVSWREVAHDGFAYRVQQAHRRRIRRLTTQEEFLRLFTVERPYGPGSGDGPAALELLVWIGSAMASGVLGNVAHDALKVIVRRAAAARRSMQDVLSPQEAAYIAACALAMFRKATGFYESPSSYFIAYTNQDRHGWDIGLSLTPHDAMPFAIRLNIDVGPDETHRITAKLW